MFPNKCNVTGMLTTKSNVTGMLTGNGNIRTESSYTCNICYDKVDEGVRWEVRGEKGRSKAMVRVEIDITGHQHGEGHGQPATIKAKATKQKKCLPKTPFCCSVYSTWEDVLKISQHLPVMQWLCYIPVRNGIVLPCLMSLWENSKHKK